MSYEDMLVINDDNYKQFIGDGHQVDFDGHTRLLTARPRITPFGCYRNIPAAKPELLIPRSKWDEIIAKKDEEKSWLSDYILPEEQIAITKAEDQNGRSLCWSYDVTINAIINRLKQGFPLVLLAAESVAGPITNWSDEGGWPETAMQRFISNGACPQSFLDKPNSLSPSRWKSGWETACSEYKITEWIDLDFAGKTFDALVSAAMWGISCSTTYSWWQHAIANALRVRKVGRKYQVMAWNSWGLSYGTNGWFYLEEGKGTPDGGLFGVSQMLPSEQTFASGRDKTSRNMMSEEN
jgi:hypothetical protein